MSERQMRHGNQTQKTLKKNSRNEFKDDRSVSLTNRQRRRHVVHSPNPNGWKEFGRESVIERKYLQ